MSEVELRPESEWKVIRYPGGGTYVSRRVPTRELLLGDDDGTGAAVIVIGTHDLGLAAATAWSLWTHEHGGPLSAPTLQWLQQLPAKEVTGQQDYDHAWWPARPGTPGAIPVVEFLFTASSTPPAAPTTDTTTTVTAKRGERR